MPDDSLAPPPARQDKERLPPDRVFEYKDANCLTCWSAACCIRAIKLCRSSSAPRHFIKLHRRYVTAPQILDSCDHSGCGPAHSRCGFTDHPPARWLLDICPGSNEFQTTGTVHDGMTNRYVANHSDYASFPLKLKCTTGCEWRIQRNANQETRDDTQTLIEMTPIGGPPPTRESGALDLPRSLDQEEREKPASLKSSATNDLPMRRLWATPNG